jgi:hypothetical protein
MKYIPLCQLDSSFPFALSSLYSGHSSGRYTWLTRTGPDGHKGKNLWILIEEFNTWSRNRGLQYQLKTNQFTKDSAI